jgi:hypothetical protein
MKCWGFEQSKGFLLFVRQVSEIKKKVCHPAGCETPSAGRWTSFLVEIRVLRRR